jgi:tetratricopeptide (TPR) repeat protein
VSDAGAPRTALQEALALFQSGRLGEAEAALRRIVSAEPQRSEALELLGATLSSMGRFAEALEWLERARAARPASASIRHNRARVLDILGRHAEALEEARKAVELKPDLHPSWNLLGRLLSLAGDAAGAERAYRRAASLQPGHAETHYNLGVFLQEQGRAEESAAAYRQALALRPAFAPAHNNLANLLKAQGRIDEALAHYREAIRHDPQLGDAYSNYGSALRELGRHEEAIPLLERALVLRPQSAPALNNLGIAYFGRNRFAEAEQCHRRALELEPGFHEARNNLGNAVAALGRDEEAIACYRAVIEQVPGYADAHSNLGLQLQERGEIQAAIACYERTLALAPAHADAINNLGYLLQEEGRQDEAMALYRRAMEADPRNIRPAYNLGLAHLCRFEFAEGWRLCELRYHTTPPVAVMRAFPFPEFQAADFGRGRRIAIWREQGVGDQVLYSTLLPELAARGERFVVEIDRRLIPALARAHPDWDVVAPEHSEARFAECDRHLAVASLPRLLRTAREDFERQPRRLLAPDAARSAEYRERLAGDGARVVGISWRSFQPKARGYLQRKKSASLAAFGALSARPGLRLLDLQYGDTAEERAAFAAAGGRLARLDDLDLFNDLDGVLAAIEACDVVVTTSNVTAHLAGALGRETLLVYLRANPPFHYWVPDEEGRSLWYPSVRIVTGAALDSWEAALARVDELLA